MQFSHSTDLRNQLRILISKLNEMIKGEGIKIFYAYIKLF